MRELVVISGKGGTGKTSIAASFAILADCPVIVDCDVDAADLHLVLKPEIKELHKFRSGYEAVISQDDCSGCGICLQHCRFNAVVQNEETDFLIRSNEGLNCDDCDSCRRSCAARTNIMIREMYRELNQTPHSPYKIDPIACEGCGVCARFCPENAITLQSRLCGEWMISETRNGPMVHAMLGIASENSGKLVSLVRREARRIAAENNRKLIITDGPPGIGCPVIASITGAEAVLVVTEPTVSGAHDLERVLLLSRHFDIPSAVCINKWDLNPEMTDRIENRAQVLGARIAGRIRYDSLVTKAQIQSVTVVETDAPAGKDIREVWDKLKFQE